jgi:hypothetical protein
MTEEQMLEELKNWDEESWKKFKETQYEVIALTPMPENKND